MLPEDFLWSLLLSKMPAPGRDGMCDCRVTYVGWGQVLHQLRLVRACSECRAPVLPKEQEAVLGVRRSLLGSVLSGLPATPPGSWRGAGDGERGAGRHPSGALAAMRSGISLVALCSLTR